MPPPPASRPLRAAVRPDGRRHAGHGPTRRDGRRTSALPAGRDAAGATTAVGTAGGRDFGGPSAAISAAATSAGLRRRARPDRRELPRPRELPAGPSSRPLALPAAQRCPSELPNSPVTGTGYDPVTAIYGTPGQPARSPADGGPPPTSSRRASPGTPAGTAYAELPADRRPGPVQRRVHQLRPGRPADEPVRRPASSRPPVHSAGRAADDAGSTPSADQPTSHFTPASSPAPEPTTSSAAPSCGPPSRPPAPNRTASATGPTSARTLRAECEQLRELASEAKAKAAQAATRGRDRPRRPRPRACAPPRRPGGRHEALVREASEISAEVAVLERTATAGGDERLQAETSHAAFAAFRRGDISAEQLREVFKRAEGWSPEHDRLSKRTNELRTEEADAARARDAAERAEQQAAERARQAAITARALDDAARNAAADARGRCAAADACEQRTRR